MTPDALSAQSGADRASHVCLAQIMHDDAVTYTFSHVAPDDDRIKVYVPQSERDDFDDFMRAEGYEPSEIFEFAFGVDDVILAFVALGGFGGLAAVLGKYFSATNTSGSWSRPATLRSRFPA